MEGIPRRKLQGKTQWNLKYEMYFIVNTKIHCDRDI